MKKSRIARTARCGTFKLNLAVRPAYTGEPLMWRAVSPLAGRALPGAWPPPQWRLDTGEGQIECSPD
jgi:hypothetical protein